MVPGVSAPRLSLLVLAAQQAYRTSLLKGWGRVPGFVPQVGGEWLSAAEHLRPIRAHWTELRDLRADGVFSMSRQNIPAGVGSNIHAWLTVLVILECIFINP